MKRPMLYILLFFVIGIIAGQYADNYVRIALFALLCIAAAYLLRSLFMYDKLLLLPTAAFIGFIISIFSVLPPNLEIEAVADTGQSIRVSGTVHSILYISEDNTVCFLLDGKVFELDNEYINEDIRIRAYAEADLMPGDMAVVEGELVTPKGRTNPSDFDRYSYMMARKQRYIMYADETYTNGSRMSVNAAMQMLKQRINEVYYKVLPEDDAALMSGMMLGDTGNIDDSVDELYKRTGIYHVIAISGLHITLLGGVLLKLFSFMGYRKSRLAVMVILACYCIMTGCGVSVIRSVLMVYVMIFANLRFKDYDLMSSAALSAILILIYSPFYIYDVGFQFSFAAVFAIGAMSDLALKYKKYAGFIKTVGVDIAADVVTKPISMYHFYYVNPWSVIANLLLVPLMSFAVALGFIMAVVGLISTGAASFLAFPVSVIFLTVKSWCGFFVSLPFSYWVTGNPSIVNIFIFAIFLIAIYNLLMLKKYKLTAAAAGICTALSFILVTINGKVYTNVTFLNVGQGDCAVGLGDDYTFVVDGGGNAFTSYENTGKRVLLPYLLYSGRDEIDGVFISHTDTDHIAGIIEIMGEIAIDKIYLPSVVDENDNYFELSKKAADYGIEMVRMNVGDRVRLNETDTMECLSPDETAHGDSNSISMVNKFVCEKGSILFTGDIDEQTEKTLTDSRADLKADVIKLAHHGSDTSNSLEFLETVKPYAAVASAKKSVYGHPGDEVLDRLEELGIPCYITESCGAVNVSFTEKEMLISTYLEDENERN